METGQSPRGGVKTGSSLKPPLPSPPDTGTAGLLHARPQALEMVRGEEPPGSGRQGLARRTQESLNCGFACSLSASGSSGLRQDTQWCSSLPLLPLISENAGGGGWGDRGDSPPTSLRLSVSPAQLDKPTFLVGISLPEEDHPPTPPQETTCAKPLSGTWLGLQQAAVTPVGSVPVTSHLPGHPLPLRARQTSLLSETLRVPEIQL